MTGPAPLDAIVVGSGPNGLAAAITLARAGRSVQVIEGEATVGGGCRSAELTLPGFVHDICSAVHPLGRGSPFFSQLPLDRHGLRWIEPPVPLAHPLDDGAVLLLRDLDETAHRLGADANTYRGLVGPAVRNWDVIINDLTGPFRIPLHPRKLVAAARFGVHAVQSLTGLATRFKTKAARALLGGCGAHSMIGLTESLSGAFGLIFLASGHTVGWPIPAGGSQRIADALAAHFESLGGTIVLGRRVSSIDHLAPARAVFFDIAPKHLLEIAGGRLSSWRGSGLYLRQLRRFRQGPGVFKLDLALDGPIPWRDPEALRAATVHVGGTLEEIVASEAAVTDGRIPERPFVLLAQCSLFDPSRAPAGRHTVWAYCHVPNGATVDMTERILTQIERFAPGFRDRILASSKLTPADLQRYNPNNVGGDIAGGRSDIWQFFARPAWRLDPYSTPDPGIFLCSASTPPGAGVHGLCGWYAAQSALRGILRGGYGTQTA
jgi:phytoene dehydrogenase-like protein